MPAKKLLAAHSPGSIDCYLCLFFQTEFQLGCYTHVCTKESHSLKNLQDLIPIYFGRHNNGLNVADC